VAWFFPEYTDDQGDYGGKPGCRAQPAENQGRWPASGYTNCQENNPDENQPERHQDGCDVKSASHEISLL